MFNRTTPTTFVPVPINPESNPKSEAPNPKQICTAETQSSQRLSIFFSLYYNSRNCSQAAMKFSCCQADEFVRICLPGRQERCDNSVALFGYLPAIGVGNFGDQSVSVQQSQSPRDLGSLRPPIPTLVPFTTAHGQTLTV